VPLATATNHNHRHQLRARLPVWRAAATALPSGELDLPSAHIRHIHHYRYHHNVHKRQQHRSDHPTTSSSAAATTRRLPHLQLAPQRRVRGLRHVRVDPGAQQPGRPDVRRQRLL